jgi:hypothetical protein
MNSLDQVGIAGEGLECRRVIPLEHVSSGIQLGGQIGELLPGHLVFEITPDPLNRVQLRAIRRSPHTADTVRPAESLRRVRAAIIQEQKIQAVGERLGARSQEEWEHVCIHIGQFQEEALAGSRRHRAIDIEPFDDVWD